MATQADVKTGTGFDQALFKPRSYDGKPRNLSRPHRLALGQFIDHIDARIDAMSPLERSQLLDACLSVSPINCSWDTYKMAEIVVWHLQECELATTESPAA